MNHAEIETIIQQAEKRVGLSSFVSARITGGLTVVLTPCIFFSELSLVVGGIASLCGLLTASAWAEGKKIKRETRNAPARILWQEIHSMSVFGENPSFREHELLKDIGRIYERDPQGEVLPLSQAIRLTFAWKQQQKRLEIIAAHIEEMQVARTTLQEKQTLLRELNDENAGLERALARMDDDITPLKSSYKALKASCMRLESLLVEVDVTIRRRELHREVGEITARLPSGKASALAPLETPDEHLDLERQIGREIETYLQLERETATHLRDL